MSKTVTVRSLLAALLISLLAMGVMNAGDQSKFVGKMIKDFEGGAVPELDTKDENWFNTEGKKLELADMTNKVVYIEFGFIK